MLRSYPEIEVERVDVLAEPERVKAAGIRRYPALVAGEHSVSSLFLTKRRIRRFLDRLQ